MFEQLTWISRESLDLATYGLMVAVFVRWVLSLTISLPGAACIGMACLACSPSISEALASFGTVRPGNHLLVGVILSVSALVTMQLVRGGNDD